MTMQDVRATAPTQGMAAPVASAFGRPGVDSLAPVTPALLETATELFGEPPLFWGRCFTSPDPDAAASGAGEYAPEAETPLLHQHGVLVLPLARQPHDVHGSRADGLRDGDANGRDLLRCLGEDYLASLGRDLFMFLEVEGERQLPSLSAEYFIGWAYGLRCASAKVTIRPCVYLRQGDDDTLDAIRSAQAEGAVCAGLWIAHRESPKTHELIPWSDEATHLRAPLPCKVLLWQYADAYHGAGGFDCSQTNPSLDLEKELLAHLVLPPAAAPVPAPTPEVPSVPEEIEEAAESVIDAIADGRLPEIVEKARAVVKLLPARWVAVAFAIAAPVLGAVHWFQHLRGGLAWGIVASVMIALLAIIGMTVAGRAAGALIDPQKLLSLSRFQMALWTVLLLSAYVTIVLRRLGLPNPLAVSFDWRLCTLMGVSTASLVGTPLIDGSKMGKTLLEEVAARAARALRQPVGEVKRHAKGILYGNPTPGDAVLTDMFGGDEVGNAHTVDLAKVQMFFFTLVAAVAYGVSLFRLIDGTPAAQITHLPALGGGFLAILAISHVAYLGGKLAIQTSVEPAAPKLPAPHPTPARARRRTQLLPPRSDGALTGSAFFAKLGDAAGAARERAALEQLLAGNVPDFLRDFVEIPLSANGHQGSIWVSPDVLAIGSDEDFVRMPLAAPTAQQVHDVFGTTFLTTKLAADLNAHAEVKLAPIEQTAWDRGNPNPSIGSNAFILEHQRLIERARAGKPLGALVSSVKKDVCLSVRLNRPETPGHLGRKAVDLYGWFRTDGTPIQLESDAHSAGYVDYSQGIRLVSTDMIVAGKPRSLFDVLEDPELAPLLLAPADLHDPSYPPPRRYPGVPQRARYGSSIDNVPTPKPATMADKPIIAEALGERAIAIGRKEPEIPDAARIASYLKPCMRDRKPLGLEEGDWCAAFVCFCAARAARPGESPPHEYRAAVWELWADATQRGAARRPGAGYTPRPGDLAIYGRNGQDPTRREREGHVGRVLTGVDAHGRYATLEGNHHGGVRYPVQRTVAETLGWISYPVGDGGAS